MAANGTRPSDATAPPRPARSHPRRHRAGRQRASPPGVAVRHPGRRSWSWCRRSPPPRPRGDPPGHRRAGAAGEPAHPRRPPPHADRGGHELHRLRPARHRARGDARHRRHRVAAASSAPRLRLLVLSAPPRLLTFVIVFAGRDVEHRGRDRLRAAACRSPAPIFLAVGRHPLAGLAAAFAGVSGGYSANLLLGTVDPLLAGLSEEAARIVDPGYRVNPAANYYFMAVSTFVITAAGTWRDRARGRAAARRLHGRRAARARSQPADRRRSAAGCAGRCSAAVAFTSGPAGRHRARRRLPARPEDRRPAALAVHVRDRHPDLPVRRAHRHRLRRSAPAPLQERQRRDRGHGQGR